LHNPFLYEGDHPVAFLHGGGLFGQVRLAIFRERIEAETVRRSELAGKFLFGAEGAINALETQFKISRE
jgi:hypothetical protein